MKRVLNAVWVMLLIGTLVLAGCSGKDKVEKEVTAQPETTKSDPEPAPTQEPTQEPASPEEEKLPTLNASKFLEIKELLEVESAAITLDGQLDDWKGITSYSIEKDTSGADLKYKHEVALAWDGNSTLFIRGAISVPENMFADRDKDSTDWWNDDIFEVFLVPRLGKDEADNQAIAKHYGMNAKNLFDNSAAKTNTQLHNLAVADGKWQFELAITLDEDLKKTLEDTGSIYAKFGVEVNSGGNEYSLLGRSGGFWDADNYIQLNLVKESEPKLNPVKFAGMEASLDIQKAAIRMDGNLDDWKDIPSLPIEKNTDGSELKYKHNMSIAWDGDHTFFVRGAISVPEKMFADRPKDSADWWNDDVFEVFLAPRLGKDDEDSIAIAKHYGMNAKNVFDNTAAKTNTTLKTIGVADGKWEFELEIVLDGDLQQAIQEKGLIFAKFGVEVNSGGNEYSILGRSGGFWDKDNYIQLIFKQ